MAGPMLKALRVGNFKAFGATQTLPIKPITLIFGANSSGKSSLIHALLLAHEAERTGKLDLFRTELGGDSLDLGGFRQYVYRRDPAARVEWGVDLSTGVLEGPAAELVASAQTINVSLTFGVELDNEGEPRPGAEPKVDSYEIQVGRVPFLRASRRREGHLAIDRLNHEHPCLLTFLKALVLSTTTTESVRSEDIEAVGSAVDAVLPSINVPLGTFLPRPLPSSERQKDLFVPLSRGSRRQELEGLLRLVLPRTICGFIGAVSDAMSSELQRVKYLGPLRSYPPRHLAADQYHDPNWLAGGGHTYDVLRREEPVRRAVNSWLGDPQRLSTPYQLVTRNLLTLDDLAGPYETYVERMWQKWDEQSSTAPREFDESLDEPLDPEKYSDLPRETREALFELHKYEPSLTRLQLLELIDKRTNTIVTHRDVGIGISQVLPVLVNAYASRDSLVAIEQPEIHLHPALQAELADVFIESALGECANSFILETHSEHLILRVMRRIRETAERELPDDNKPIHPSDVAVLYVQPEAKGAEVIEIKVTEEGEFATPWPNGFFADRAKELF